MGDELKEGLEPESPAGNTAGGAPAGEGQAGQDWSGPSQEEWKQIVESNKALQAQVGEYKEYFESPELTGGQQQDFDPSDLDLTDPYTVAALVNSIVEDRLQSVTPYVRSAAQDQGKRQMATMFDELEKEVGSFDHDLAERTAFYFFDQSGNAEASVREAAKYAAEVRKRERDDATSEMRSRATRRGSGASEEVSGSGSAVPGETPARSYDEVIDKYAHQTEF